VFERRIVTLAGERGALSGGCPACYEAVPNPLRASFGISSRSLRAREGARASAGRRMLVDFGRGV